MKREQRSPVGLIETLRVKEGQFPFLQLHRARLVRSLRALRQAAPQRTLTDLVQRFATFGEAVVRVEVLKGAASVMSREVPSAAALDVIVAAERHVPYAHKTTQRDAFDDALEEATVAGVDDALLLTPAGVVAEGTAWSVFWWEGKRLCTPALSLGILPGIGRARVMQIALVEEGRFTRADLDGRSLFLVNAVRGVQPIATLDHRPVPADSRTAALARRFWP